MEKELYDCVEKFYYVWDFYFSVNMKVYIEIFCDKFKLL